MTSDLAKVELLVQNFSGGEPSANPCAAAWMVSASFGAAATLDYPKDANPRAREDTLEVSVVGFDQDTVTKGLKAASARRVKLEGVLEVASPGETRRQAPMVGGDPRA